MTARMKSPALIIPEAMQLLLSLAAAAKKGGVPSKTAQLVVLRASQINGCALCVDMHARDARKEGETNERLDSVAAWHDAPWFTDAERAALALTEETTRISDRPNPVSDATWAEAAKHFDEAALASLVMTIALINTWNRLNVATRQPPLR